MRRRGRRRQPQGSTPVDVGTALRQAREEAAIGLAELQDRIGVPEPQLEALESGNLSRFPDLRSAEVAVKRYSDLVQLDPEPFVAVLETHWGTSLAGFPDDHRPAVSAGNGATATGGYLTIGPASTGHLSRYPGDGTHLRAFTQTDEVPGVRRSAPPPAPPSPATGPPAPGRSA